MNFVFYFVFISGTFSFDAQKDDAIVRGRYTENIPSFETVIPRKVTETGSFLTHRIPHFYGNIRRSRRNQVVHYIIPLDGSDHLVSLWPSDEFLSPSIVVEHHETGKPDGIRLKRQRTARCLFSGIVRGVEGSSVALSTCSGLAGFIKTPSDYYFIEPAHDSGSVSDSDRHPHLVYKPDLWSNGSQTNCGTVNRREEALKDRLRWEALHGRETEERVKGKYPIPPGSSQRSSRGRRGSCDVSKTQCMTECPQRDSICFTQRPMYLELMVTIDHKTAGALLTDDVDEFLDAIVNMVVTHFFDASLGHTIYIKLVRKLHLGFTYAPLDVRRYSPQRILNNFCDFQMFINSASEEHPNHHDFAVLITKYFTTEIPLIHFSSNPNRFHPCQGRVLGMTNLASICRPDKSCAVVSGDGLLLANIITHQIGHSLSAEHDDSSSNSCAGVEPDGTVYHMNPIITTASTEWSSCSRQCVTEFLKTHVSWCLIDVPLTAEFAQPVLLPGQVYTPSQQCTLNFAVPSIACLVGEFCERLFCQITDTCVSTGSPPAQGTQCGPNMWCFNGKCVWRGQRPGAINGEWGPWSPWTSCTKTCGGGVQSAHRACTDPAPAHGGRYCVGNSRKNRICSVKLCPGLSPSFSDIQCKLTDSRHYNGIQFTWNAYSSQSLSEHFQCVLVCINEKKQIVVRSPIVIDGTFCRPGKRDVCVQGKCERVGCDWVIGSKAKEDACGICHGNGTGCRIIHGIFSEENINGMVPILKLPVGTSMIFVRETLPSPCYLTITDTHDSRTFYLNNYRDRDTIPGIFHIQQVHGVYQLKGNMERIFIKPPITTPIALNVICHHVSKFKGLYFQYAIPERNIAYIPVYRWQFIFWNKCSHPCGGGSQHAEAVCVEERGGEVEDSYCNEEARPINIIRICNQRPCSSQWLVGPWASCNCYLGEGITTRLVICGRVKDHFHMDVIIVKPKNCQHLRKPRVEKPCNQAKDIETILNQSNSRERRDAYDVIPYDEDAEEYESTSDLGDVRFFNKSVNVRDQVGSAGEIAQRIRRRLRAVLKGQPSDEKESVMDRSVKKCHGKATQLVTRLKLASCAHLATAPSVYQTTNNSSKDKLCAAYESKVTPRRAFHEKLMEPEHTATACASSDAYQNNPEQIKSVVETLNASNFVLMDVKIETTDRLIRQHDDEFILLNNLELYPVGNPEKVIPKIGECAVKFLKQLQQDATARSTPDIIEGKNVIGGKFEPSR